jgi:hypothetical protein
VIGDVSLFANLQCFWPIKHCFVRVPKVLCMVSQINVAHTHVFRSVKILGARVKSTLVR